MHKTHHNNTQDLHDDLDRIRMKARETREAISQTAHDVKQRANEALMQSLKEAKDKTADLQENVVTYVRDNPVKSVGIAIVAGFLFSKLMK